MPLATRFGIKRYNLISSQIETVTVNSDTKHDIKRNPSTVVVSNCAVVKLRRRSSSMHEPLTPADNKFVIFYIYLITLNTYGYKSDFLTKYNKIPSG